MNSDELAGELEMCAAMYSDAFSVTRCSLENLSRQSSRDGGPASPSASAVAAADDEALSHHIITLRLRKGVEVEMTTPVIGYWAHFADAVSGGASPPKSAFKPKLRVFVNAAPICVDSELLRQAMTTVIDNAASAVASAGGGCESNLVISVCQAAEQFVEEALSAGGKPEAEASSSSSSSSSFNKDATGGASDDEAASVAPSHMSAMMMMAERSRSDGGGSGGGVEDASLARYPAELIARGIVRHSAPIHDKKSVFLAHACPVASIHDVHAVVHLLRTIDKIAGACHPAIYAYRFRAPSGVMAFDTYDDGEKNGARNILAVLEHAKIGETTPYGFVVVVTRYFGGTLLGTDRFKHIATVSRGVLIEAGAIASGSKK